jgi:TolB protein
MGESFNAATNVFSTGRAAAAAALVGGLLATAVGASPPQRGAADESRSALESRFLGPAVQVTQGMPKAGEGYFASDMRRICYQAVPESYPFYQIFVQPFDAAAPRPAPPLRISTGRGRTTCSFFSPDGRSLLFASSHLDPGLDATEAAAVAQAEEDRKTGRRRRYQWDFDPQTDIFVARLDAAEADAGRLERLTRAPGYDAECAFSPDGRRIVFVSDRDGDPDIYVMDADGGNVRQLTDAPGYDGGPFFSPDGRWIAYRTDRLEKDMLQIHVMRADGSGDVAVTSGKGVHWAPFWHPLRPWLIWTGADHSDPDRRPNYDLWIARHDAETGTESPGFRTGDPLRITDHAGADVLPAFSPDGTLLMWTASRGDAGGGRAPASQLWVSRIDASAIEEALPAIRPER